MNKIFVSLIVIFITNTGFSQIPSGYYDGTEGLEGNDLKMALRSIIDNHTVISYDNLWDAFDETDKQSNGKVWDIYSTCSFTFFSDQCGSYSNICDCYNREHTVPQSWFNEASPMKSDLFHVYPTDGKMNGYRSDYPYGECNNGTTYTNGLGKLGSCTYTGYSGTVFEPDDEYKGDIARTYFYMATRYNVSSWDGASFSGDGFSDWTLNMLLEWDEQDPVSQKEIDRNEAIYDKQHNRNPYIDHPEWVPCVFQNQCGIEDPADLTATPVSSSQINLNWNLNPDNNDVLLAYNTTNTFGTPTGSYSQGQTISGGGTILYIGSNTSYNHTGLTQQTYYYKLWSYNGTDYSSGITANATPFLPEPTDNVTNLHITNITSSTISLAWTDAEGTTPPTAYLIRMATDLGSIQNPTDGTPYSNDGTQINVNQGVEMCDFVNLNAETEYFFKIFPYTNSGSGIDYKTDNNPSDSATTLEAAPTIVFISEVATKGYNVNYNDEYIELSNISSSVVDLSTYTLEYYEGINAEAILTLTGTIQPFSSYLIAARTTYTSAISPDFVPATSFTLNNNCYLVFKNNGDIVDLAGNENDMFIDGNNYEFTECLQDNEPTANWLNHASSNGTPGVLNCNDLTHDVSELNVVCYENESDVSWTNPETFDEVILVVHTSFISGTPVGTYTANSSSYTDVLNPDFPNGGKVVYNGTNNFVNVTDLDVNTTYYFKVFTLLNDLWSNGIIDNCTTVLNIDDYKDENIIIYPNPTNGFFTVSTCDMKINSIVIYNYSGQEILTDISGNQEITFDFNTQKSGLYIIKIETENYLYYKKIIVQ